MTYLCPICFENSILQRRIVERRRNRKMPPCSFHKDRKSIPAEEVAAIIDPELRANYTFATDFFGFSPGSSFHELLIEATEAVDDAIVQAVVDALIDGEEIDERDGDFPFYGEDQNYEQIEPDGWLQSQFWAEFRFF